MSSFQGGWNGGVPLYTEVSSFQGGWNGGVPLYTEVSSFQGVGIEEFYCIQRCQGVRIEISGGWGSIVCSIISIMPLDHHSNRNCCRMIKQYRHSEMVCQVILKIWQAGLTLFNLYINVRYLTLSVLYLWR